MKPFGVWGVAASAIVCAAMLSPTFASAQTAQEGKNVSALARENLDKPRPKPPFDLTGTWNFRIDPTTGLQKFEPHPKLTPAGQAVLDKYEAYQKKGLEYRDDPGACWPLGVPRELTRFWPSQIIQLPTMVTWIYMFNNDVRWIYLDGRSHPADQDVVSSYNGHSIGHWDGDALVVDTVGFTDDHHWVQEGIQTGTNLHVVERYTMSNGGKTLKLELSMTDPDNWVGEWKSTKYWDRDDKADIEEHTCIYEQVNQLPSFKYNVRK